MTWEELKEESKKMGATIYISPYGDYKLRKNETEMN